MNFLPCSLLHHLSALLCKISFLHKMTLHLWLSARYHNFKASLSSQNIIADVLFRYAELYSLILGTFILGDVAIEMICLHILFFLVQNIVTFADFIHKASLENVVHLHVLVGVIINTPQGHCEELVEKGRLWSDLGLETRSGTC